LKWIADLDRRGAALARAGKVATAAYVSTVFERERIHLHMVHALGYSQARAARELQRNRDEDVMQAFVGVIIRSSKNAEEAESTARAAFNACGLRMSQAMRDRGASETVMAMRGA
jgi:hypothetical protein